MRQRRTRHQARHYHETSRSPTIVQREQPRELTVYLKLILVSMVWGGTFIAARLLAPAHAPNAVACSRFFFASVVLLGVKLFFDRKIIVPSLPILASSAVLGFFGAFVYNMFFFRALSNITAGRAALIVSLNPILTTMLSFFFFKEPLTFSKILGSALALLGVATVLSHGALGNIATSFGVGEAFMLISVCAWTLYTLLGRFFLKHVRNADPLTLTTYACISGFLLLSLCSLNSGTLHDFYSIFSNLKLLLPCMYLGVLGTALGFVFYYDAIKQIGASRAAIFNNLVPVMGVLMGALLLGETLDASVAYGGTMVVIAIFLTTQNPSIAAYWPRNNR